MIKIHDPLLVCRDATLSGKTYCLPSCHKKKQYAYMFECRAIKASKHDFDGRNLPPRVQDPVLTRLPSASVLQEDFHDHLPIKIRQINKH